MRILKKLEQSVSTMEFFTNRNFVFSKNNYLLILDQMNAEEKKVNKI